MAKDEINKNEKSTVIIVAGIYERTCFVFISIYIIAYSATVFLPIKGAGSTTH